MNSWIKLSKDIIYWGWYKDINTFKLFIHCVLKANWKDSSFQEITVKRGSFITSLKKLSEETGLSIQNVRTSLKKLISTQELTQQNYKKFTIITVKNYNLYQNTNTINNTQLTQHQHVTNNNRRIIDNMCVNNTRARARKTYCHLGAKYKTESCKDCIKNLKCRNKTSSEFIFKHECTFEEWNKKRLEFYKKWCEERKSNNQSTDIELFDYDWINDN